MVAAAADMVEPLPEAIVEVEVVMEEEEATTKAVMEEEDIRAAMVKGVTNWVDSESFISSFACANPFF